MAFGIFSCASVTAIAFETFLSGFGVKFSRGSYDNFGFTRTQPRTAEHIFAMHVGLDPDTDALATSLIKAPETPVVKGVIPARAVMEVGYSYVQYQAVTGHWVLHGLLDLINKSLRAATILE
jgi:hypothetical protein